MPSTQLPLCRELWRRKTGRLEQRRLVLQREPNRTLTRPCAPHCLDLFRDSFSHFEPEWVCEDEERLGSWSLRERFAFPPNRSRQHVRFRSYGEGGKFVCGAESVLRPRKRCLVYSIGSGDDWSFEQALKSIAPNCEIHTFDHTYDPWTGEPLTEARWGGRRYSDFHPWQFHGRPLQAWMKKLGHAGRRLDVLKVE